MGTVIHDAQHGNADRHQRWDRIRRAELLEQYRDLQAQGLSQRQAAQTLEVPRTTLQAWRAWQDRLDACPQVVEFFESVPVSPSCIAWCWRSMWCVSKSGRVAFGWSASG